MRTALDSQLVCNPLQINDRGTGRIGHRHRGTFDQRRAPNQARLEDSDHNVRA